MDEEDLMDIAILKKSVRSNLKLEDLDPTEKMHLETLYGLIGRLELVTEQRNRYYQALKSVKSISEIV